MQGPLNLRFSGNFDQPLLSTQGYMKYSNAQEARYMMAWQKGVSRKSKKNDKMVSWRLQVCQLYRPNEHEPGRSQWFDELLAVLVSGKNISRKMRKKNESVLALWSISYQSTL